MFSKIKPIVGWSPVLCPFTVTLALVLCLAGCGHHPEHAERGEHSEHGQESHDPGHEGDDSGHDSHDSGHESHGSELELTLNDGEKWQVDEHTRLSAARLSSLVGGFETIASVADARDLSEKLDQELDVLVKGCTMTGAAHDQLHVFLLALFPKVTDLQEKTDVSDLQRIREEIGSVLEAYAEHFE